MRALSFLAADMAWVGFQLPGVLRLALEALRSVDDTPPAAAAFDDDRGGLFDAPDRQREGVAVTSGATLGVDPLRPRFDVEDDSEEEEEEEEEELLIVVTFGFGWRGSDWPYPEDFTCSSFFEVRVLVAAEVADAAAVSTVSATASDAAADAAEGGTGGGTTGGAATFASGL